MSLLRNGKLMSQLGSSLPSELNSDWDSYKRKQNGCSLKCWLTSWNYGVLILIWFGSGANIVFAVLGRMRLLPLSASFTYTDIDPTVAVIGLEILTFLLAVVGFSALIRQNTSVLYLVCILYCLLFIAHSGISIVVYTYIQSGSTKIAHLAKQTVLSYKPGFHGRVNSLDYVQEQFGCCGAMSYTDWLSNSHYKCPPQSPDLISHTRTSDSNSNVSRLYCGVPSSCCRTASALPHSKTTTTTPNACGHYILRLTHNEISERIHPYGCYDVIWSEYRSNYLILASITLTLAFILVICILITHTSIKEIQICNKKQENAQKKRMQVHQIYNDL